jgi:hypothetical protein
VSELITAYQEVADAAVPAVRPEWDELMATYRQAEALVHLDRDLTKDELAELDRLNDEITRLAGEIDAKNAGICVGDDPSTGA